MPNTRRLFRQPRSLRTRNLTLAHTRASSSPSPSVSSSPSPSVSSSPSSSPSTSPSVSASASPSPSVSSSPSPEANNVFTVIQIPDTQDASVNCSGLFDTWISYIGDEKDSLNVQMAMCPGDIVTEDSGSENTFNNGQFTTAKSAYDNLVTDGVSFSLSPANHDSDDDADDATRDLTSWDSAFPLSYFSSQDGYGGAYDSTSHNTYFLKTLGGKEFMFLNLEQCPRDVVKTWAVGLMTSVDPDYVILGTHHWLVPGGDRDDGTNPGVSGGSAAYSYYGAGGSKTSAVNSADDLYTALHSVWPEKFILTFGQHHTKGQPDNSFAEKRTDIIDGYNINQVGCNYQNQGCDDQAYLRIYEINVFDKTIDATTYNPSTEDSKTDSVNQFSFTFS